MSRLVDPTICPDCRAPLDTAATCTGCGLKVTGPLATELWSAMVRADGIVEQLRALSFVPATVPEAASPTRPTPPSMTPMPALPPVAPRRLPAMSVPVVLLSLGALCLLVAGVVFVAVTWSALGLTGRTLVLLGFTALLAGVAIVLTRKGLRGAAETFWLIVAGMLAIDLLAAESAGLAGLDALTWRGTGALVGGALFVLGAGVAWWAHSQPVRQLYGAGGVAICGALLVTFTNGWLAENPALGSTVALVALAAGAVLLVRPVRVVAIGLGALASLTWLVVLGHGLSRAGEISSPAAWWTDLRGWPLLAAAAAPALAVLLLPRAPHLARIGLATAAVLPLAVLANAPAAPGHETREQLVRAATLVVLALVTAFAPRTWSRAAAVWTAVGAVGLGVQLLVMPWTAVAGLPGAMALDASLPGLEHDAAAWTWLVVAASVVAGLWALSRVVPELVAVEPRAIRDGLAVLGIGGLTLGAMTSALGAQPALWLGIAVAGAATAVVAGATWLFRRGAGGVLGGLSTAYLAALTLTAAETSEPASAVVATLLTLALVVAFAALEDEDQILSAALVVVLAGLGGCYSLVAWGHVFDADSVARALAVAGYAALLGLVTAVATVHSASRIAVEGTALLVGIAAVTIAPDAETAAMVLTVLGSAIAAVAVTNRDRSQVSWAGAAVLLVATAIRFDLDVAAPELYTLPAALLLVAAGLWRLQTDKEVGSLSALGSGLTLALLPSLLLALEEPVTLRGALIAAGGVAVLALGVQRHLSAPLVLGALTTGLLAVRHLEPYADALPRWISLGAVGVALLAVGITWEARLSNLHTAKRYLTGLR